MKAIHTLIEWRMRAFERRFGYDMAYARGILRAGLRAFSAFNGLFTLAAHRGGVPLAAWTAAKWAATASEGCGPCGQLVIDMGREQGLEPARLRAIAEGDLTGMGEDVALVYRWACAVVTPAGAVHDAHHDPEQVDRWREAIVARWGERGLVALTLAMAGARSFPMVKRALGHAAVCALPSASPGPTARAVPSGDAA